MPDINASPLWMALARSDGQVGPDGTVGETVFGQMTQLAAASSAVNLGQGAPGTNPPEFLLEAAALASRAGANQYPPGQGQPALLEAVSAQRARDFGLAVDPAQVLVTLGVTEAITATVLALVPRGGTVVTFEPFYDSYAAATELAGATLRTVPIRFAGESGFAPDWDAFAEATAAGVDAVIVNSPHNPTGFVFSPEDLLRIHAAAQAHDFWVITDEVYEHLAFAPNRHVPLAALVPDSQRIISTSSAGKTFNITGWKIGWVVAPGPVRLAIQTVKQFLTFTANPAYQLAVAQALVDARGFIAENPDSLLERAHRLATALRAVPGLRVSTPQGGYFIIADFSGLTDDDAFTINERLSREFGFTGIPVAGLCRAGSPAATEFRSAIRYSYCKSPADVALAVERIGELAAHGF